MTRFAISKDFESLIFGMPKSEKTFELVKIDKDEYALLEHKGNNVNEIYTFTKEELRTLWLALTTKK
jgi:hypothetical protein